MQGSYSGESNIIISVTVALIKNLMTVRVIDIISNGPEYLSSTDTKNLLYWFS